MLGAIAANRRRGGGAPAYPLSLSPFIWFDPSDMSTLFQDTGGTTAVTADGQSVARINDKSGNARHATQATSTKRPVFRDSGGLRWLEFDGVDDFLSTGSFGRAQAFTAGAAALFDSGSGIGNVFSDGASGALMGGTLGSAYRMYAGVTLSGGTRDAAAHTMIGTFNGSSSELVVDTTSYTGSAGTSAMATGLYLGAAGTGGQCLDGRCYQFIGIPGILDATGKTDLTNWLKPFAGL